MLPFALLHLMHCVDLSNFFLPIALSTNNVHIF